MRKIYLSFVTLAALACGFVVYANAIAVNHLAEMPEVESATVNASIAPTKGKVLVVYFTSPETDGVDTSSGASRLVSNGKLYGNTEYVATLISEETGGDLFQIKTTHAYPGTHKELIDAAKKEVDSKARPKLATHIKNLADYDIVFIGFPNWWYDMPMALYSFFDEYDFTGKTLIPFCTHGGSRFSQAEKTIASLEKGAKMQKGLAISRNNVSDSGESVLKWLRGMGMTSK